MRPQLIGFDCWPFNPDLVLVDTQVVAGGPVRAFVAVWGTPFRPGSKPRRQGSPANTIAGGQPPWRRCPGPSGLRHAHDHGLDAKRDVELGVVTPAVEKVIEANVLLSGLRF